MFFYYFLSKRFLENFQGAMLGNNFLPGGLDTACPLPKLPLPVIVMVLGFYKRVRAQ